MSWVVTTRLEFDSEEEARAAASNLTGEVSVQEHVPYSPPDDVIAEEEDPNG